MTQCLLHIARLGGCLGSSQERIAATQICRHVGPFNAGLLHQFERFARVDCAELTDVTDQYQPLDFSQVGEPHQTLLIVIGDHRRLVEYEHAA